MRGERPKVLPKRLQLHASLPAIYSQERARLIDKQVTAEPTRESSLAREPAASKRVAVETSAALQMPGPYAGVKNWARYLARN